MDTKTNNYDYILYFDGCSKCNPGVSGAGAVIYSSDETTEVWAGSFFVGNKETNNVAEYFGLIKGMQYACEHLSNKKILVKGDSLLVIKQMRGEYKINAPNLKILYNKAKDMEKKFEKVDYLHVYRTDNKRADQLSNEGLQKT